MKIEDKVNEIAALMAEASTKKINLGQEIIHQMNDLLTWMDILGLRIYDEDNEPVHLTGFKYEECYGKFYLQTDDSE